MKYNIHVFKEPSFLNSLIKVLYSITIPKGVQYKGKHDHYIKS